MMRVDCVMIDHQLLFNVNILNTKYVDNGLYTYVTYHVRFL